MKKLVLIALHNPVSYSKVERLKDVKNADVVFLATAGKNEKNSPAALIAGTTQELSVSKTAGYDLILNALNQSKEQYSEIFILMDFNLGYSGLNVSRLEAFTKDIQQNPALHVELPNAASSSSAPTTTPVKFILEGAGGSKPEDSLLADKSLEEISANDARMKYCADKRDVTKFCIDLRTSAAKAKPIQRMASTPAARIQGTADDLQRTATQAVLPNVAHIAVSNTPTNEVDDQVPLSCPAKLNNYAGYPPIPSRLSQISGTLSIQTNLSLNSNKNTTPSVAEKPPMASPDIGEDIGEDIVGEPMSPTRAAASQLSPPVTAAPFATPDSAHRKITPPKSKDDATQITQKDFLKLWKERNPTPSSPLHVNTDTEQVDAPAAKTTEASSSSSNLDSTSRMKKP